MKEKKPTNAQLTRRLERAILHIDRTKNTEEVYFDDKGLRIVVNEDYAIIETSFHRHVFNNITSSGFSRPYLYAKRFLQMAKEQGVNENGVYTYEHLFSRLKESEKPNDYNTAVFIDWWLFNIFAPLYSIGETEAETFLVYEDYIHNIARQKAILKEKDTDVTNNMFLKEVIDSMKELTDGLEDNVLFKKMSDEEMLKEEMKAMNENDMDNAMEAQADDAN